MECRCDANSFTIVEQPVRRTSTIGRPSSPVAELRIHNGSRYQRGDAFAAFGRCARHEAIVGLPGVRQPMQLVFTAMKNLNDGCSSTTVASCSPILCRALFVRAARREKRGFADRGAEIPAIGPLESRPTDRLLDIRPHMDQSENGVCPVRNPSQGAFVTPKVNPIGLRIRAGIESRLPAPTLARSRGISIGIGLCCAPSTTRQLCKNLICYNSSIDYPWQLRSFGKQPADAALHAAVQ